MILALLSLIAAIACYSISQLLNHGKFRWSKKGFGFWDYDSDKRKYMSKLPFARTLLVWTTDGYHLMQSISFLLISLTVALLTGFPYLIVWLGVVTIHAGVYRIFQK